MAAQDGLAFDFIDEEVASWLKRQFEESEVLKVVKCKTVKKRKVQNCQLWGFLLLILLSWKVQHCQVIMVLLSFMGLEKMWHASGRKRESMYYTSVIVLKSG